MLYHVVNVGFLSIARRRVDMSRKKREERGEHKDASPGGEKVEDSAQYVKLRGVEDLLLSQLMVAWFSRSTLANRPERSGGFSFVTST